MAGSFIFDLDRFTRHATTNINDVVRGIVLGLGREVVKRSPVGDPEWWRGVQVSPGVYEHAEVPDGYVGGHFKGNWQHGIGVMPLTQFDTIDRSGGASIERIQSTLTANAAGKIHYLVNNLPYSIRIENGWSWHQAPRGVVGLSVLQYPGIVRQVASEVNR
jgi:hypothetical protein